MPMFLAMLFTIAKLWNQPKCSSKDYWINKLWNITQWNTTPLLREDEIVPLGGKMYDSSGGYVKWNKPECERKLLMVSLICGI